MQLIVYEQHFNTIVWELRLQNAEKKCLSVSLAHPDTRTVCRTRALLERGRFRLSRNPICSWFFYSTKDETVFVSFEVVYLLNTHWLPRRLSSSECERIQKLDISSENVAHWWGKRNGNGRHSSQLWMLLVGCWDVVKWSGNERERSIDNAIGRCFGCLCFWCSWCTDVYVLDAT